jgi:hypothetical protein
MDNDEPMEYQWIVAIANKLGASRQHCFSERLGHTENKVVVGGGWPRRLVPRHAEQLENSSKSKHIKTHFYRDAQRKIEPY